MISEIKDELKAEVLSILQIQPMTSVEVFIKSTLADRQQEINSAIHDLEHDSYIKSAGSKGTYRTYELTPKGEIEVENQPPYHVPRAPNRAGYSLTISGLGLDTVVYDHPTGNKIANAELNTAKGYLAITIYEMAWHNPPKTWFSHEDVLCALNGMIQPTDWVIARRSTYISQMVAQGWVVRDPLNKRVFRWNLEQFGTLNKDYKKGSGLTEYPVLRFTDQGVVREETKVKNTPNYVVTKPGDEGTQDKEGFDIKAKVQAMIDQAHQIIEMGEEILDNLKG